MVAWEKQIEERSVPAWRAPRLDALVRLSLTAQERYVAYARLKRKLVRALVRLLRGFQEQIKVLDKPESNDDLARRISGLIDVQLSSPLQGQEP